MKYPKPNLHEGVIPTINVSTAFDELILEFKELWGPNTEFPDSRYCNQIEIMQMLERKRDQVIDKRYARELYETEQDELNKDVQAQENERKYLMTPQERKSQRQRLKDY